MELTKFERRVLDPHYLRKCRWYYLYIGIAFVALGIFVLAYGYTKQVPQTTAIWENNISSLKKIVPNTKNEKKLFDVTMSTLTTAKKGWTGYVQEKTKSTSILFLMVGSFLLGMYLREKRYRELIQKIEAPNLKG